MSFMDIFRKPAQPQQQQQPVQQQPGQQQPANQHVETNPQVPNSSNTPQQQPTPENPNPQSPNDKFAGLWNTPTNNANGQAPNFKLAQEQLDQVASKINFSQGISQDALSKVAAGGQEAVEALGQILNQFGQNVFKTNAQFSSHITEAGYGAAQEQLNKGLPTLVKQQLSTSQLFESNPALRDPAIQPVVRALHSQLTQQHPEASPAEINGMLSDYMSRMNGAFNKADDSKTKQTKQDNSDDFSSFLIGA